MIWEKVHLKLDMQCLVSFNCNEPVEAFTREYGKMGMATPKLTGKTLRLTFYFHSMDDSQRYTAAVLKTGAIRHDGIYSIEVISEDDSFSEFFRSLVQIESFVMGKLFVRDGRTHMSFRFYSTDRQNVSTALFAGYRTMKSFRIEYFGSTRGLTYPLKFSNNGMPHDVLLFVLDPPLKEMNMDSNPIGREWIREVRYRSEPGHLDCLYYMDEGEQPVGKHTVIAADKGIYGAITANEIVDYLWELGDKFTVFPSRSYHQLSGNKLKLEVVYPKLVNSILMKILIETTEKFPEWNLTLGALYQMPSDIIEPIGLAP
ncbi:MAG: hypothetical protein M1393_09840 [Candidatus Thermoplasmatota archaeon]|nr:hypothetical protein [Candidatus Thermoplasmatota archaeon]MCL6091322.1 hypothetical protein [Candidatus Thermoplasmatota archaeon]